jgi:FdhE protein
LSAGAGPAQALLTFYARVLGRQHEAYLAFSAHPPSESVEGDLSRIAANGTPLLDDVATSGPPDLARQARRFLSGADALEENLLAYWGERSDRHFFAKALFQPYMSSRAGSHADHVAVAANNRCPRCGGHPQASMVDGGTASAEGGRRLLCATCLTTWPFRRVLCPSCGEEDERKLGYFRSAAMPHVRVDACETCRRYLKTIDLGRTGLAEPIVDEVAAAVLDVWAGDHGYQKIELNLAGL